MFYIRAFGFCTRVFYIRAFGFCTCVFYIWTFGSATFIHLALLHLNIRFVHFCVLPPPFPSFLLSCHSISCRPQNLILAFPLSIPHPPSLFLFVSAPLFLPPLLSLSFLSIPNLSFILPSPPHFLAFFLPPPSPSILLPVFLCLVCTLAPLILTSSFSSLLLPLFHFLCDYSLHFPSLSHIALLFLFLFSLPLLSSLPFFCLLYLTLEFFLPQLLWSGYLHGRT